MESLSFQYPSWYAVFCVLLGLIFAAVLYYRDKTFQDQQPWKRWLMAFLRFLTVTFLSLLLLSPILKSLISETKKPVIVLAQDNSESVGSAFKDPEKQAFQDALRKLKNDLSEKYEVKNYLFGEEVRENENSDYTDKISNFSEMMRSVYDLYSNQNLGAVVVASDGIYNEGSNPLYAGVKLSAPVFTVALGDTTLKKDLLLKRVFHNKIVYLGDKFSILTDVAATNCVGANTNLVVRKLEGDGAKVVAQFPINIDKNDFFTTREIILEADKSGVQRYQISLSPIAGEAVGTNNLKDIFIDVLDARQKILVLANSPHPDLSAIKQALETSKNYSVVISSGNDGKATNVAEFDFVILHQLPSKTNPASAILQMLDAKRIPRLFVAGSQTDFARLNQVQSFMQINSDGRNINEVQATVAPDFNFFTIDDKVRENLPKFVPLTAPFGEFKAVGSGQTLLYQRIGKVETKYPLLTVGESGGIRGGVLAAEGIFRWRLFDYLQHQNHDVFNEIIGKTIQYLSLKEDKRKFRISLPKNVFNENEPVVFDAELYNENFELINEPDASLVIRSSDKKEFPFTFSKTGKTYNLNAGIFPVGNYSFRGSVANAGQQLTFDGQFSVQAIQLEGFETTANHGLLRSLSQQYGGQMLSPTELSKIPDLLAGMSNVKPVIYNTTKTRSAINLKWIFFLLLTSLSLEWFMRRYLGAY